MVHKEVLLSARHDGPRVGINLRMTPEGLLAFDYPQPGWESRVRVWLEQWDTFLNATMSQQNTGGLTISDIVMPTYNVPRGFAMAPRRACALYVLDYLTERGYAVNSGLLHHILAAPSPTSDAAVETLVREAAAGVSTPKGGRTARSPKLDKLPGSPFVGLRLTVTGAFLRTFAMEGLTIEVAQTHPISIDTRWWAPVPPHARYVILSRAGIALAQEAKDGHIVPEAHLEVLRNAADAVIKDMGHLLSIDALRSPPLGPQPSEPEQLPPVGSEPQGKAASAPKPKSGKGSAPPRAAGRAAAQRTTRRGKSDK